MSNNVVGGVYQSIIEEVMNTSRVDFEENGVEESVLEDLCKGWKNKLSQLRVAQFPWDPKPDLEQLNNAAQGAASASKGPSGAAPSPTSTHHVDTSFSQPIMSPVSSSQGLPMSLPMPSFEPTAAKTEDLDHGIKLEPDMHHGSGLAGVPAASHVPGSGVQNYTTLQHGGGGAAARAMQQLQNTFGQRAAASINAIHSGMSQGSQQQPGQRPEQNGQMPQQVLNAQQYRAQMAAQSAQAAAQLNGANSISRSQVDGADDGDNCGTASFFEGVLMQQRVAGQPPVELGRIEIDNLLHEQMALRAKQMEGGGLMLPLRQATKHRRSADTSAATAASRRGQTAGTIAQADGADDDDDEEAKTAIDDEDAINSDLDDPDEDREDDDDEDDVMGPIMLCVYDKVQRVKNKWKCTLKDGVLTVNGKEYVFHKATGEYEW